MGLLDWLTEGVGSDMGGSSMGSGFKPPPPMPPMQATGDDVAPPKPLASPGTDPLGSISGDPLTAPPPYPPGLDPMRAGGDMPNGPGLPFALGGDPMAGTASAPADPMIAGGVPSNGPGLPGGIPYPPGGDPMTAGGPMPSGPGLPPQPPGANFSATRTPIVTPNPAAGGIPLNPPPVIPAGASTSDAGGRPFSLLRAMGLDNNSAERMRGSLGAGLKSVATNAHQPGLGAFAGSLGAGIEGGKTAGDKQIDQQDKYLTRAIAAANAGNTKAANEALTELRKAQTQQIKDGKGDKASVMNSTEQLYLRGLGAVNQNPQIKASAAQLKAVQSQFGADSKEAKTAMTAHNSLIETEKKRVLGNLGINEKDAAKLGEKPGFSDQNPVKSFPKDAAAAQKTFDALPVGAYFINPKDGRLLIKQPPQAAAAGANPAAAPQSPPTAPPMLDPAQAQAPAAAEEED